MTDQPKKRKPWKPDIVRRVKRRTVSTYRNGRRIIVSLLPGDVLSFREERTRREYLLSIAGGYEYAVRLEVERKRREKAAKRGKL